MFDYERQNSITEMFKRRSSLTTAEIAARLFVSEATVRRDLTRLEQAGLIKRVHGGAVFISGPESEIPLVLRDNAHDVEKQNIASKAIRYIKDGYTIMLDASSTVYRLIPLLGQFTGLTVVTNGPKAVLELANMHIKTLSTGGSLLENSLAFVGRQAEQFVENINADVLFLSCRGISEEGYLTDSSLEESNIRKAMLKHAKKSILLCDSSKMGIGYTYNIARLEELNVVISEKEVCVK